MSGCVRVVSASVVLYASASNASDGMAFPVDVIESPHLKVALFRPDAQDGFYRGTRFDWSGIVAHVEFAGHRVFAPFAATYDARLHDNVSGPSEEFGMDAPIAYDETPVGGYFIKIGVGHLLKQKDETYGFSRRYEIAGPAPWEITAAGGTVEYRQTIVDPRGWGYVYVKRVTIDPYAPGFAIQHELTNTGWRRIETDHYNHCFFIVDGDPVGPGYELRLPCDVTFAKLERATAEDYAFSGRTLRFLRPPRSLWGVFAGPTTVDHNAYAITHARSGITMTVRGDRPPREFRLYAHPRALCPEPFVAIAVEPGQTFSWQTVFAFSKE